MTLFTFNRVTTLLLSKRVFKAFLIEDTIYEKIVNEAREKKLI